jgi:hypothetical protein
MGKKNKVKKNKTATKENQAPQEESKNDGAGVDDSEIAVDEESTALDSTQA